MIDAPSTKSPRWQAVGLVIDQNARDILANRYGTIEDVVSWFKAIALFRQAENERMIEGKPSPADKRHHKTWLITLIAEGERLLTRIQAQSGLPRNKAGIRPSDVEATIEELCDTQAEWYGGMTAERKTQLLRQMFDVPAA